SPLPIAAPPITLTDEVQLGRQSSLAAPGQQLANVPTRARQTVAPQSAVTTAPQGGISFGASAVAPAEVIEEKLKRNESASIANAPQSKTEQAAAARYYRLNNGVLEDQVAQRTETKSLAKKVEPAKAAEDVLSQ